MEMTYGGALVMPSSYAVMDEEEMMYLEGGFGVPRGGIAFALDVFFMATPLGAAFAPFKYLGRAAGKALVKKYAGSIVGMLGKAISFLGGAAGSFAINFSAGKLLGIIDTIVSCATSLGGIISLVWDCVDEQGLNGWIGEKMW
ncbi:MAG: hypothetical protein IJA07_05130 [Agathobacter sp.]|nr:hypothetical protein [Agathobacter sp.]